jgi:transcriptional regulator with XRE-family HTH domain
MNDLKSTYTVIDLRTRLNKSRAALALELGISERTLYRWELGETEPSLTPRKTVMLLSVYQCTAQELADAFDNARASYLTQKQDSCHVSIAI